MSIDLRLGELERLVRWLSSRSERALEAEFVDTATGPASSLRVTVPGYDDGEHTFGPVVWSPLGNALPAAGDRCLVAESDDGSWWVLAWWSADQALPAQAARARVFNSANIPLTSATLTVLTFDSERFDDGGLHSPSSSRLTAPITGLYVIGGQATFAANATGYRLVTLRLNGTTRIRSNSQPAVSGDTTAVGIETIYQLAADEYVEMQAFQTSGGPLNVAAELNSSPEFWMSRIG